MQSLLLFSDVYFVFGISHKKRFSLNLTPDSHSDFLVLFCLLKTSPPRPAPMTPPAGNGHSRCLIIQIPIQVKFIWVTVIPRNGLNQSHLSRLHCIQLCLCYELQDSQQRFTFAQFLAHGEVMIIFQQRLSFYVYIANTNLEFPNLFGGSQTSIMLKAMEIMFLLTFDLIHGEHEMQIGQVDGQTWTRHLDKSCAVLTSVALVSSMQGFLLTLIKLTYVYFDSLKSLSSHLLHRFQMSYCAS